MYDVNKTPMAFFENGSSVEFKINLCTTPSLTGTFYGEVVYYSPTSNSWVVIWFSHNYQSVPEAFEDCWNKQQEFIECNPEMAC